MPWTARPALFLLSAHVDDESVDDRLSIPFRRRPRFWPISPIQSA